MITQFTSHRPRAAHVAGYVAKEARAEQVRFVPKPSRGPGFQFELADVRPKGAIGQRTGARQCGCLRTPQ